MVPLQSLCGSDWKGPRKGGTSLKGEPNQKESLSFGHFGDR